MIEIPATVDGALPADPEILRELLGLQQALCLRLLALPDEAALATACHEAIGSVTLALAQLVEVLEAADAAPDPLVRGAWQALYVQLAAEKRAAAEPLRLIFG